MFFWFKNKNKKRKETITSMYQTTVKKCEEDMLDVINKQKNIIGQEQGLELFECVDYDIKDIKVTYLDRSEATRTYNLFIILTVEYIY